MLYRLEGLGFRLHHDRRLMSLRRNQTKQGQQQQELLLQLRPSCCGERMKMSSFFSL
jgi:hypothetical protein